MEQASQKQGHILTLSEVHGQEEKRDYLTKKTNQNLETAHDQNTQQKYYQIQERIVEKL